MKIESLTPLQEWRKTAAYEPVDPQPPEEVLRDREKWQLWCPAVKPRSPLLPSTTMQLSTASDSESSRLSKRAA